MKRLGARREAQLPGAHGIGQLACQHRVVLVAIDAQGGVERDAGRHAQGHDVDELRQLVEAAASVARPCARLPSPSHANAGRPAQASKELPQGTRHPRRPFGSKPASPKPLYTHAKPSEQAAYQRKARRRGRRPHRKSCRQAGKRRAQPHERCHLRLPDMTRLTKSNADRSRSAATTRHVFPACKLSPAR